MFKIENGQLTFEDSVYALPKEVAHLQVKAIYGTATAGLDRKRGILVAVNGKSGTVVIGPEETISGHLIDTPKIGCLVYLREQLDADNPSKTFWLMSSQNIKNNMNWLNVQFTNGTFLRLCPFTSHYKVEECR